MNQEEEAVAFGEDMKAGDPAPLPRKSEVGPSPIRLTHKQIMENYELLARKQGYLVLKEERRYFKKGSYADATDDQKEAFKNTFSVLVDYGDNYLYELVDQDVARDIKAKKCSITKLLGQQVVEMLKVAPSNPVLLAQVLAATGQNPPVFKTYEELKTWVETNCGPKLEPRVEENCLLRVRFQNQETGICKYSVENRANRDYTLQHDIITKLAQESPDWESFSKAAQDYIIEHAEDELDPELDGQGYDYDDHVSVKTTEIATTILSRAAFAADLADVMRRSQTQDVLTKLGLI